MLDLTIHFTANIDSDFLLDGPGQILLRAIGK